MTYRVYVRWPGQKTSHKTASESISIAQAAFDEITDNAARFIEQGALGVTFTKNGKQVNYHQFTDAPDIRGKRRTEASKERRRAALAADPSAPIAPAAATPTQSTTEAVPPGDDHKSFED